MSARKKAPSRWRSVGAKRTDRVERAQHIRQRTNQPLAGFPVGSFNRELRRFVRLVIAPRLADYSTPGQLTAHRWLAAQRVALAALNTQRRIRPKGALRLQRLHAADAIANLANIASRWSFRFDRMDAERLFIDLRQRANKRAQA